MSLNNKIRSSITVVVFQKVCLRQFACFRYQEKGAGLDTFNCLDLGIGMPVDKEQALLFYKKQVNLEGCSIMNSFSRKVKVVQLKRHFKSSKWLTENL